MTSSFRYTDEALEGAVNLHIFSSHDGIARADVKGPTTRHLDTRNESNCREHLRACARPAAARHMWPAA